jgi:hypothetical protein
MNGITKILSLELNEHREYVTMLRAVTLGCTKYQDINSNIGSSNYEAQKPGRTELVAQEFE